MQIGRSREPCRSGVLILALGLLFACGDSDRGADIGGDGHVIATAEDAAAHLRSLYFAQASSAADREGGRLVKAFPESPRLQAWHVLALARSGKREGARAGAEELLDRYPQCFCTSEHCTSPAVSSNAPRPSSSAARHCRCTNGIRVRTFCTTTM